MKKLGLVDSKPRGPSTLGWLQNYSYDGNVIGGLMQGAGMAIAGACPGTVLVQIATGIRSGWFVMMRGPPRFFETPPDPAWAAGSTQIAPPYRAPNS